MLNKIKQHKVLVILGIIIFLAFLVRVWNIDELFVFKMDQARDISLVQEAYDDGVGELPLLGPRAAKTYLRLGPIFYYFEYLSMRITGNSSPLSVVWPDFILSILIIPLFYYFLRQVFSKKVSLMTIAVFASSFFLTQYSHFAWNPNSIPFWSLLFFLGMYKIVVISSQLAVCSVDGNNNEVRPFPKTIFFRKIVFSSRLNFSRHQIGWWLLVTVLGYGVASQLHFTAMLAYPLVAVLFGAFFWRIKWWSKISWKYWLGAFAILGVLYGPMILSEIYTDWDNWLQFKYALSGRGKEEFSLYAKLCQSLRLHSEYFYFTLTSFGGGGGRIFVVGYLVAIIGAFLMVMNNFKFKIFNVKNRKNIINNDVKKCCKNVRSEVGIQEKKVIFFVLIFIWFVVIGLLYTKLAFSVLKPRYWLLNVSVVFIVLAIWLEYGMNWLKNMKHRGKTSVLMVFVVVGLVVVNLYAVGNWYWTLQNQKDSNLPMWNLKLKDENRVSYGQLKKVVAYINSDIRKKVEKDNKEICFYTTGEYRPVYDYIFEKQGLSKKIRRMSFKNDSNKNCLFIAIDHNQRREIPRIPRDHKEKFEKVKDGKKEIGFVTVWRVAKKSQETNSKKQINYKEQEDRQVQISGEREAVENNGSKQEVRGGEIQEDELENNNSENIRKDEVVSEEKIIKGLISIPIKEDKMIDEVKEKKPKRKERIRWRDIFGGLINLSSNGTVSDS